jgi:hypothetical protein
MLTGYPLPEHLIMLTEVFERGDVVVGGLLFATVLVRL